MKVDYLFTTSPILSETFYQREIRALAGKGVDLNIYSLWGADPGTLQVIRRGLSDFPLMKAMRATRAPLRLLCMGRLIEKIRI